MMWRIRLAFIALSGFISIHCWAVDIEVTQASPMATPIAVFQFADSSQFQGMPSQLSDVIRHDLTDSGCFNVVDDFRTQQHKVFSVKQLNPGYWRTKSIDYVVLGQVHRASNRLYSIHFDLVNLLGSNNKAPIAHQSTGAALNLMRQHAEVMVSRTFEVRAINTRAVAHLISDLVYKTLIGRPGVFSTKIAYVSVKNLGASDALYRLKVADQDGYNEQNIVVSKQPIMSPAWSPDGTQLAYVSFEGGVSAIYIQNLTTGHRTKISELLGINGAPAFSPDGQKIAMVLTRPPNMNPKIYVKNLQTGHVTQVTKLPFSIDTEPAWAPDGKSLIFTSSRQGGAQIFRYFFDSGEVRRLTYQGNYNATASFLPGGNAIVMMHRDKTGDGFGIAIQQLTHNSSSRVENLVWSGYDESPSVSPNGQMVLYATKVGARRVLKMVSLDGRSQFILPGQGAVQDPVWSPFIHHSNQNKGN